MIDIDKIKVLTNWEPKTDLVTGITETVKWYREYYADRNPEEVER
jgi:nucleoside-diphosphate-sugar epimerase